MTSPCSTCDERDRCFGGCRCQAYQLTGDATVADPVCDKSPDHGLVLGAIRKGAKGNRPETGRSVPVLMRNRRNAEVVATRRRSVAEDAD